MSFTRKFKNTHETIMWWVKPEGATLAPFFNVDAVRERSRSYDRRNNLLGKNPGNVWVEDRVAFGGHKRATSHIAIYPESITERIIRACSTPNDIVLDPFAGSGTTPAMARQLGRKWVGIELSQEYASEAERRLRTTQPSEAETLVSGLIKVIGFDNRISQREVAFVADSMAVWFDSTDLRSHKERAETELRRVYGDDLFGASIIKEAKPDVLLWFDNFFHDTKRDHPIVLADSILNARYRQRSRWNGLRRYLSAIDHLTTMGHDRDYSGSFEPMIRRVALNETDSFKVSLKGAMRFLGPSVSLPHTLTVRGAAVEASSAALDQSDLFDTR